MESHQKDILFIILIALPAFLMIFGVVKAFGFKKKTRHILYSMPAVVIAINMTLTIIGIRAMGDFWGGPTHFHPYPVTRFQIISEFLSDYWLLLMYITLSYTYYIYSVNVQAKNTNKKGWLHYVIIFCIWLFPLLPLLSICSSTMALGTIFSFPFFLACVFYYLFRRTSLTVSPRA